MNPIERNVAISNLTDQYIDMLVADCIEQHGDDHRRLYERLMERAKAKLQPQSSTSPEVQPMNEAEASVFSRQPMKWGLYKNQTISEVPEWYLVFLADSEFAVTCRRYLKSSYYERVSR